MYGYLQYLVFIFPALLLGLFAQFAVKTNFNRFAKVASRRGMTGADAAKAVLASAGVKGVSVGRISGELTDNYNPKTNSISLSQSVYDSTGISAIGVAAHEAGHALQYAEGYSPIKLRAAIIPVCNIGSTVGPLLIILGCMISYSGMAASAETGNMIYFAGIILFSAVALFQLVTLPVELNASSRALKALESGGVLEKDELPGAKKVLTAAALTYVAALVTSVMQIIYYATRFKPKK